MKFDVYERVRDPLHDRHEIGGVHEGFAQVLDCCFSPAFMRSPRATPEAFLVGRAQVIIARAADRYCG
jgi:hypothetical protein